MSSAGEGPSDTPCFECISVKDLTFPFVRAGRAGLVCGVCRAAKKKKGGFGARAMEAGVAAGGV